MKRREGFHFDPSMTGQQPWKKKKKQKKKRMKAAGGSSRPPPLTRKRENLRVKTRSSFFFECNKEERCDFLSMWMVLREKKERGEGRERERREKRERKKKGKTRSARKKNQQIWPM